MCLPPQGSEKERKQRVRNLKSDHNLIHKEFMSIKQTYTLNTAKKEVDVTCCLTNKGLVSETI